MTTTASRWTGARLLRLPTDRPWLTLALLIITTGFLAAQMTRLTIRNDPYEFLPSHPLSQVAQEIRAEFGAESFAYTLFVRFAPRVGQSITDPQAMLDMESVLVALRAIPGVEKASGLPDLVKFVRQEYHGGDPRFAALPVDASGDQPGPTLEALIKMTVQRMALARKYLSEKDTALVVAVIGRDQDIIAVSREAMAVVSAVQQKAQATDFALMSYGAALSLFNLTTARDIRVFFPVAAGLSALAIGWIFGLLRGGTFPLIAGLVLSASGIAVYPLVPSPTAQVIAVTAGLLLTAATYYRFVRGLRAAVLIPVVVLLVWRQDELSLAVAIAAAVAYSFRALSNFYLPFASVLIAGTWTFGLLGLNGTPLNFLMTAVIPLLLGVGIDYPVYLLHRYDDEKQHGRSGREAMQVAARKTGRALLLTVITTIAGFSSLVGINSPPIQAFGLVSNFAVASSFLVTLTLVPAVKSLLDDRDGEAGRQRATPLMKGLSAYARAVQRRPLAAAIAAFAFLLALLSAVGGHGFKLASFDPRRILPRDHAQVRLYDLTNQEFRTYDEIQILVRGDIATLPLMRLQGWEIPMSLGGSPYVRQIASIAHYIDDVRNANAQIGQEFIRRFSAEGPDEAYRWILDYLTGRAELRDDLRAYVHRDAAGRYDAAVVRISALQANDQAGISRITRDVASRLQALTERMAAQGVTLQVTGAPYLSELSLVVLRESFFKTLGISLLLCFLIISLGLRSLLWGAISLTPVVLATAFELGTIQLLGIELTVSTVMVTAISIGLGVDYAIHLLSRYREHYDLPRATARTGEALFGDFVTTISAFLALLWGGIAWNRDFGALASTTVTFVFLATVFVLPALMALLPQRRDKT